jgi:hypothetical protein
MIYRKLLKKMNPFLKEFQTEGDEKMENCQSTRQYLFSAFLNAESPSKKTRPDRAFHEGRSLE